MNWVPLFFIDAVCHQLKHDSFKQVTQLSRDWSKFGAEHNKKRREFEFSCQVDGTKSIYCIEENKNKTYPTVTVADLNIDFDRITSITLGALNGIIKQWTEDVPLDALELDVIPTVASILTNCFSWTGSKHPIFLKAFKNCPKFNKITFKEHGQESRDFVVRQVELGNVETLQLHVRESDAWPQPQKLADTLETFVNSARFYQLTFDGTFPDDIKLCALFLKRALAGELKPFSFILMKNITTDAIHWINSQHSEFGESSMIARRIPNSNRKVMLQRLGTLLRIKVQ